MSKVSGAPAAREPAFALRVEPQVGLAAARINAARTAAYNPNARAYEAFRLGTEDLPGTRLRDPLQATSLNDALAETTMRWAWDRGDRLGIREIGERIDLLHIYAARRKSAPSYVVRAYSQVAEHRRWLEHVCTVDLNVIAGIPVGLVGVEFNLHERRQRQRPIAKRMNEESKHD